MDKWVQHEFDMGMETAILKMITQKFHGFKCKHPFCFPNLKTIVSFFDR